LLLIPQRASADRMLISDKLVFIEFRNTGASHVEKLLLKIVGGEVDNSIRVPTEELLASGRPMFGSIRDPWGWYLSLWTFGCAQQGELYQRMVNEKSWRKLLEKIEANAKARSKEAPADEVRRIALPEQLGADRARDFWYASDDNVEAFREWLRVVCALQARRVIEPGFAYPRHHRHAGGAALLRGAAPGGRPHDPPGQPDRGSGERA
jgi:hypothetical protein